MFLFCNKFFFRLDLQSAINLTVFHFFGTKPAAEVKNIYLYIKHTSEDIFIHLYIL